MPADDFQWNDDRTRYGLRDYTLIIIEPEVAPVALINIMRTCLPRQLFFSTHAHAIRYSEAWARKWEQEIRLHVGNNARKAGPFRLSKTNQSQGKS